MLEDDDAGKADWDCGEGKGWEERWMAGEDMDACLSEGVKKLVKPA